MKRLFASIAVSLSLVSFAFAQADGINILPKPYSLEPRPGSFSFGPKTKIFVSGKVNRQSAAVLNALLLARYGFSLEVTSKRPTENYIAFSSIGGGLIDWQRNPPVHEGSYSLEIDQQSILLMGVRYSEIGKYYAIQSLM